MIFITWGKVDGSGVRWKMMLGFVGFSTESEADHDVSPLSELAVHVYRAVSSSRRSDEMEQQKV